MNSKMEFSSNDFDDALNWLKKSGIIENNIGGVNGGFDLKRKRHNFYYFEITGYAINLFLSLYRQNFDVQCLRMAEKSGQFLLRYQCKEKSRCLGAFPHILEHEGNLSDKYYSFDTAVCTSALTDLYEITKDRKYLDGAIAAGKWLLGYAQNSNGSFKAVYDLSKKRFINLVRWDGDNGCLHAKNALSLIKLGQVTNYNEFLKGGKAVLDWVLRLQNRDGSFKSYKGSSNVFTHAHCYATEGLLFGYNVFRNETYLKSAIQASDWLLNVQNNDGSLYKFYYRFMIPNIKVVDATAQSCRIWAILHKMLGNQKYLSAIDRSVEFIRKMKYKRADRNYGSYYYGCTSLFGQNIRSSMIYTWPVFFVIQAYQFHRLSKSTPSTVLTRYLF